MSSTRDTMTPTGRRAALTAALFAGSALLASNALAEIVSIQFSQSIPGGGTVTGLIVGEDLDGDGRLYSMAPGLAEFIGAPVGDEVIYASVRIDGVLGDPVTVVYDREVAGIDDPANFFFGFSVGIGNDYIGQDPEDGLSFAPLAPSTSYVAGALMAPAWHDGLVIEESMGSCGDPEVDACSAIITLDPVDPFPNFELMFHTTSDQPIVATELLRYTFEQTGFDGGASVTGTISGRDLNGDGRLYSAGGFYVDVLGFPPGDEIAYASVTIKGVEPQAIVNTVDLVTGDINDFDHFFFGVAVNIAGDRISDEEGEGISIAPFSPSTSYIAGDVFEAAWPDVSTEAIANCANDEGLPCGRLLSLEPDDDSPTGVVFPPRAEQYSAGPVALHAAPFIVDAPFTGFWQNAAPSGEGFEIHIIQDGRALVYWLTYDEAGNQRWLFGPGSREGLTIRIPELTETSGGMLAAQEPIDIGLEAAGSLEIQFSGCNSAAVAAVVDEVPRTMQIERLTAVNGLECIR